MFGCMTLKSCFLMVMGFFSLKYNICFISLVITKAQIYSHLIKSLDWFFIEMKVYIIFLID